MIFEKFLARPFENINSRLQDKENIFQTTKSFPMIDGRPVLFKVIKNAR
jgi:hypothetical protein